MVETSQFPLLEFSLLDSLCVVSSESELESPNKSSTVAMRLDWSCKS